MVTQFVFFFFYTRIIYNNNLKNVPTIIHFDRRSILHGLDPSLIVERKKKVRTLWASWWWSRAWSIDARDSRCAIGRENAFRRAHWEIDSSTEFTPPTRALRLGCKSALVIEISWSLSRQRQILKLIPWRRHVPPWYKYTCFYYKSSFSR